MNPDFDKKAEIKKYDKVLGLQVNSHKPQTNSATIMGNRSLYSGAKIGERADDFDIQNENNSETDLIIRAQSPSLLAIRNQNMKINKQKHKPTNRPMSNIIVSPSHSTETPSYLNPKPMAIKKRLSPMEIAKNQIEQERYSLDFKEDPIAYFSKRKDGTGHLFITMNLAKDRSDPTFSPYELVKVPNAEKNSEYFTMSAQGVTHILPNGEADHTTLEQWAQETNQYKMIHALRFFLYYRHWKFFRIWCNYIKRHRYKLIVSQVLAHPLFFQDNFFSTVNRIMETSCGQFIKQYLLSFWPQRKYSIKLFQTEIEENKEHLIEEYQEYLFNVVEYVLVLDADIRDPTRVLVKETDFTRGKMLIPNLGQLMAIREKVDAEKARRDEKVHKEIVCFCDFIRMLDYLLLETLSTACLESWTIADQNVSQEMSSIFQIDLYFTNDGKIAFNPTLDDLLSSVKKSLLDSITTLLKLPRLINEPKIRPLLRELYSNIRPIIENGPHFDQFCKANSNYKRIHNHIVEVITKSYHESEDRSQAFIEFFPLYKIGQEWSPQMYIMPRGGESHLFNLVSETDKLESDEKPYLLDPATELIIDFDAVKKAVNDFLDYDTRLTQFHAGSVRGVLYVNSKNLRSILTPIPTRSIRAIQMAISDLIQKKIDDLSRIIRFSGKKIKKEPTSLEQYVNYCEFTKLLEDMSPFVSQEIEFVDKLYILLEFVNNACNDPVIHTRNPLHDLYRTFKNDQSRGNMIKDLKSDKFVQVLSNRIKAKEIKLQKYNAIIQSYPESIDAANLNELIDQIEFAKEKLVKLEPKIQNLMRFQEVMGVKLKDFGEYEIVQQGAAFTDQLFKALKAFQKVQNDLTNVPFSSVDVPEFTSEVVKLRDETQELIQSSNKKIGMLDDMYERLCKIVPYIEQLVVLSESKMHIRHWNNLFEQCGQPNSYYAQIKIDELITLGVLNEKEIVKEIASTAKGESQLETDFQAIQQRWQEVKVPIQETSTKSVENLLLGDIDRLYSDISDTQIELNQMLLYPYAQGIGDAILQFSSQLENYAKIMDSWETFQSNWVLLNPFFSQEETKRILPQLSNRFSVVKRRWQTLIHHTLENQTLIHVCSFPSLLEILTENNKTMESLLQSSLKFIETKRESCPRLYFMSDSEVITLFSISNFRTFTQLLSKLFMDINYFKSVAQDDGQGMKSNSHSFSRLRIMGIGTNQNNVLNFTKAVQCLGSIDTWVKNIIGMMQTSVKDSVLNAIKTYSADKINDWVKNYPTSICQLAINILYTMQIDECFNNFENNVHSFAQYKERLLKLYDNLLTILKTSNNENLEKLSAIITAFNLFLGMTEILADRLPNFPQELNWTIHLKIRIRDNRLYIEFDQDQIEFGYEFYGNARAYIYSQSSQTTQTSICDSLSKGKLPYCIGSPEVGKKHLLTNIAFLYGQFVFSCPAYLDITQIVLSRIFIGAAVTGCWAIFHDINLHSRDSLTFIYDTLHEFQFPKVQGEVAINGKQYPCPKAPKIIFTGHHLLQEEKGFLPQLRGMLKPISFGAPEIDKIALIKFTSYNYSEGESISLRLVNLLRSITNVIAYLPSKSILPLLMKIIDKAKETFDFINKSKSIPFFTFNESITVLEEYSVVYASYKELISNVKIEHRDIFYHLLYSYFPLFNSFETFKENLTNHDCFEADICEKILSETLRSIIHDDISPILAEYLIDKTISFYNLMKNNPCVVIYGPPNSGKTKIIELLEKAFEKICEDEEKVKKFRRIRPIKQLELFYNCDIWEEMFGEMKPDPELGHVWHYGMFHSYIVNLMKFESTHHKILHLNGPLNQRIIHFLSQMVGTSLYSLLQLTTLDSFKFDGFFHIVIETGSVSDLSPSCLAFCGILPMENLNSTLVSSSNILSFDFFDPLIIINRAISQYGKPVSTITKNLIMNLFTMIATDIIKFVFKTPNCLYHFDSNSRTLYSTDILIDHLAYMSVLYMLNYLDISSADKTNEEHIKLVMIISFYTIYSTILEYTLTDFESFIKGKFELELPQDWINYDLHINYHDYFPRPSLNSLRFSVDKLIPYDSSQLDLPPIISNNPITSNLKLLSNVSIPSASYLPLQFTADILIKQKQHFLLYGPSGCGKTTLLKFLLRKHNNIIPMTIPVSNWSTKRTFSQFIRKHSKILQKKYMLSDKSLTFALIFDNVPSNNNKAIEFIRMLVTMSSVPFTSRKDPKYLDILEIRNFFVIVTSQNVSYFSPRFISNFYLMKLEPPNDIAIKEIYHGLGTYFNINEQIVDIALAFAQRFRNDDKYHFHFLSLLRIFPAYEKKEVKTLEDFTLLVQMLFYQLYLTYAHRLTSDDEIESFKDFFKEEFESEEHREILSYLSDEDRILYSEIEMKDNEIHETIITNPIHLMEEELHFYLNQFNAASDTEKLQLKFSSPVIKQWSILQNALTFPGSNVLLVGEESTGRYTLTRFISHMKQSKFIKLEPVSDVNVLDINERRAYLIATLGAPLRELIHNPKPLIIYFKYNKYSEHDFTFLSHLYEFGDPTVFFSSSQLDEIYYMYGTKNKIPQDEKLSMFNQICEIIKMNVHIIISFDSIVHDEMFNMFTKIEFISNSSSFISNISKVVFSQPRFEKIKNRLPNLTNVTLYQIHQEVRSKFPNLSINSFYDFIDNFIHFYGKWYEEVISRKKQISEVLDMVKSMKMEIERIQTQISSERPNISKQKEEDNKVQQSYNVKRDTIQIRLKKIADEENKQSEELSQLNQEIGTLRVDLNDASVHVDLAKTKLESLNVPLMSTLLTYVDNPPPVFKYVMDLLTIMMDKPKSFGPKLFKEEKLIPILFEQIVPQYMDTPTIEKAQKLFMRNKFDARDAGNVCAALLPFFEWGNAILKLAIIQHDLNEKEYLYQQKSDAYADFVDGMRLEMESIQQVQESLEKEIEEFQKGANKVKSKENEFDALEKRQKTLEELLDGTDSLIQKWETSNKNFEKNKFKTIGQSITFAAMISYSGMMNLNAKKEFYSTVHKLLDLNQFTDSYNTNNFINLALAILHDEDEDNSLRMNEPTYMFTTHSLRFISTVPRTPLIIDPDGLIHRTLSSSIKEKRLVQASMISRNLNETFLYCMSEGKTLLLEDVDWLHPLLLTILPTELYPHDVPIDIVISNKKITINPKFRLYLFSSKMKATQVPSELASRVTLIDFSDESLEATKNLFVHAFVHRYLPDYSHKIGFKERIMFETALQRYRQEGEMIEILNEIASNSRNDPNYDYLDDEDIILNFFQIKESLKNVEKAGNIEDINSTVETFEKEFSPLRPIVTQCFIIWETITRVFYRIKIKKTFSFTEYCDAIQAAFNVCNFQSEKLSDPQLSELERTVQSYIFNMILPSLSFQEIYFFLFYLSIKFKILKGKCPPNTFDELLNHLIEEYDGVFDMKTADIRAGDMVDQLKFSNIGSIFPLMTKFISDEFGKNFGHRFPMFSLDLLTSAPASTPILIKMCKRDPALILDEFSTKRNITNPMYSISLSHESSSLITAEKVIKDGIENSWWVIIQYHLAMPMIGAFLDDMSKLIEKAPSGFRLVIICHSTSSLPNSLLKRCKLIEYESFPSIRTQMLELYQHYSLLLTSSKYCTQLRQYLYAEALMFSVIRYRMFIQPIGFFYDIPIDESMFKSVFEQTIYLYEKYHRNNASFDIIRNFIMSTFFSGIITNEFDFMKVNLYTNIDIDKSLMGKEQQQQKKLVLFDDADQNVNIWQLPSFTENSTSSQLIKKLTHFGTGEVLLMNTIIANPLIQWNLSRWSTKLLLNLKTTETVNFDELKIKLESLKALFPAIIDYSTYFPNRSSRSTSTLAHSSLSPISLFMLAEVDDLNKSMMSIKEEIHDSIRGLHHDVMIEISNEKVPKRWCSIIGFVGSRSISRFFGFLREKSEFLQQWIRKGPLGSSVPINIAMIRNVKGLFLCFLNEIAIQRRSLIVTNDFICVINDHEIDYGPMLTLNSVWLVGGNWDQGEKALVAPNSKTLPMRKLQEVMFVPQTFINESQFDEKEKEYLLKSTDFSGSLAQANIFKRLKNQQSTPSKKNQPKVEEPEIQFYDCPVYSSLPCQSFSLPAEKDLVDGRSKNLICKVKLRTKIPIKNLVADGVCLVCHMPDIFAS